MGKGDKKTRRGKIVNGSYGVTRPRRVYRYIDEVEEEKPKKEVKPKAEKKEVKEKKAPAKKKKEE